MKSAVVAERRLLCVSPHDVAPATLDDCIGTLAFLDTLRISPVALLVVPDYHGLGRADRDERFCEFLRSRTQRGDEVVLHGYWHRDAASPDRGLRDWFERRVCTAGEGEFSRLDRHAARTRILRGLAVLRSAGMHPSGFVTPAWLISPGTRDALDSLPLQYCATRDFILTLKNDRRIAAPSLVVSSRSPWRRVASPLWNHVRLGCRQQSEVLRAALHPGDIRYPEIRSLWRVLFGHLADRGLATEARVS